MISQHQSTNFLITPRTYIITDLLKCVYWIELVSLVSDVAHGQCVSNRYKRSHVIWVLEPRALLDMFANPNELCWLYGWQWSNRWWRIINTVIVFIKKSYWNRHQTVLFNWCVEHCPMTAWCCFGKLQECYRLQQN